MRITIFFVLLGIGGLLSGSVYSAQNAHSYTMEEMYQMATYFRQIREGKELGDITKYAEAAEFRGYIAAVLDESDSYDKCAKKYNVNDIAMRTAIVMTSLPLDRSLIASGAVRIAMHFGCDDTNFKKK